MNQQFFFGVFVTILLSFFVGTALGQSDKLFGYEGHDFNTFFAQGDLSNLDKNVIEILRDQTTNEDWFAAQDVAEKELLSDQARLLFCQQLKNEGYYRPFVNCQEAIYDQFLYQNMYKNLATKKLIENAKKMVSQGTVEGFQTPQTEEQNKIKLCTEIVFSSNQTPTFCEKYNEQVESGIQKLKEKEVN